MLSLCNALEALPPQRRLAVAKEVIMLCEAIKSVMLVSFPFMQASSEQRIPLSRTAKLSEFEPVEVQLERANEILSGLERQKESDQESVLKLASAISSAIFAIQILAWAQRHPADLIKFERDEIPDHGVYEDAVANVIGETLWKQVHSIIIQERTFRRRSEDFIYQPRPIEALARSWLHEQLL